MRRTKYSRDLPRRMYSFFAGYSEPHGAPSFSKFARSTGLTLKILHSFRKHRAFDEAYLECNEIRRDYLIDQALTKRFDSSLVKFLLDSERECEEKDEGLDLRLEVVES